MFCCDDGNIEKNPTPLSLKPSGTKAILTSYDAEAQSKAPKEDSPVEALPVHLDLSLLDTGYFQFTKEQEVAIQTHGVYDFSRYDEHPNYNLNHRYEKLTERSYKFIGQVSGGKMTGRCHFQTESGDFFVGLMNNDVLEGIGAEYSANGDYFLGSFVEGKKTHGLLKTASGNQYEGDFKDGKYHGSGKLEDKAGRVYTGGYVEGNREGYGVFVWADGSRYEGGFKNNLQEGKGTLVDKSGKTIKGVFEKGQHIGMQD